MNLKPLLCTIALLATSGCGGNYVVGDVLQNNASPVVSGNGCPDGENGSTACPSAPKGACAFHGPTNPASCPENWAAARSLCKAYAPCSAEFQCWYPGVGDYNNAQQCWGTGMLSCSVSAGADGGHVQVCSQ